MNHRINNIKIKKYDIVVTTATEITHLEWLLFLLPSAIFCHYFCHSKISKSCCPNIFVSIVWHFFFWFYCLATAAFFWLFTKLCIDICHCYWICHCSKSYIIFQTHCYQNLTPGFIFLNLTYWLESSLWEVSIVIIVPIPNSKWWWNSDSNISKIKNFRQIKDSNARFSTERLTLYHYASTTSFMFFTINKLIE